MRILKILCICSASILISTNVFAAIKKATVGYTDTSKNNGPTISSVTAQYGDSSPIRGVEASWSAPPLTTVKAYTPIKIQVTLADGKVCSATESEFTPSHNYYSYVWVGPGFMFFNSPRCSNISWPFVNHAKTLKCAQLKGPTPCSQLYYQVGEYQQNS